MSIMNNERVLVVVPTDRLGGAELNLKRITLEAQERGAKVSVIVLSRGNNGGWKDVEVLSNDVYYVKSRRESLGFIKAMFLLMAWRIRGRSFNYSFTSHTHCNAFVGILLKFQLLKVAKVVYRESSNHFSWKKGIALFLFRWLYVFYSKSALIICQTHRMKDELLLNVKGVGEDRVVVIPNSVDYDRVQKLSKEVISEHSCSPEDIVAVGRLVMEKDYPTLIKAFACLGKKECILRIIGEGVELERLQALVECMGLKEGVLFMGHMDNPYSYMRTAKLCVLSSKLEGFPNVLLEMMCVSRQVVATECTDGIRGLPGIHTCSPEDHTLLANTMNQAMELDEKKALIGRHEMCKHVKSLSIKKYVNIINDYFWSGCTGKDLTEDIK